MNKNQKIVLEYLKNRHLCNPFLSIWVLCEARDSMPKEVMEARNSLTEAEEFEVLAEFAKWGLKND